MQRRAIDRVVQGQHQQNMLEPTPPCHLRENRYSKKVSINREGHQAVASVASKLTINFHGLV